MHTKLTNSRSAARNVNLDATRSAAILMVLCFHYDEMYNLSVAGQVAKYGWAGVDLFFVLSGFLITGLLIREIRKTHRVDVLRFYLRRALRIFPAYLVMLALYLMFPEIQEGRGLQELWRYLSFTQNLPMDLLRNTFSHSWSLAVEEHFYLLLPIALLAMRRLGAAGSIALLALLGLSVSLLSRFLMWNEIHAITSDRTVLVQGLISVYYPSFTRIDGLAIGALAAALHSIQDPSRELLHGVWGVVVFCLGVTAFAGALTLLPDGELINPEFFRSVGSVWLFLAISLSFGMILLAALISPPVLSGKAAATIRSLAVWSFPIYLCHKAVFHVLAKALGSTEGVFAVLAILVAILVGAVLHLSVEAPLLSFRERWRLSK